MRIRDRWAKGLKAARGWSTRTFVDSNSYEGFSIDRNGSSAHAMLAADGELYAEVAEVYDPLLEYCYVENNATIYTNAARTTYGVIGRFGAAKDSVAGPYYISMGALYPGSVYRSLLFREGFYDFEAKVPIKLPGLTTTERNALTGMFGGMTIYNTTTSKINVFEGTWKVVTTT